MISAIFYQKPANFAIWRITDIDYILMDNYIFKVFVESLKIVLINMVTILIRSNVFWKKVYDITIYVYGATNKILSRDSKFIVDVIMWPKFFKSSIFIRELIITSILTVFDQKKHFLEEWPWFKFNNFWLALGIGLKFYTSVTKQLNLKVTLLLELILIFAEFAGEKHVGGFFLLPTILNRVKRFAYNSF